MPERVEKSIPISIGSEISIFKIASVNENSNAGN
jgi:hypothetical protein